MNMIVKLERVKGIEPSHAAWKAAALPLSYTRSLKARRLWADDWAGDGGQRRIRTFEDVSQQIYSLPRLATSVSTQRTRHKHQHTTITDEKSVNS